MTTIAEDYKIDLTATDLLLPQKTELANAVLCDDMPPLANIAMGPTGRSVARSYAAAISKLVPAGESYNELWRVSGSCDLSIAGTPIGIDDEGQLTEDQQRYKKAMAILSAEVPDRNSTFVELYTKKQEAYTKAVEEKNKAFRAAQDAATNTPGLGKKEQRKAYDQWVQENAKTWRARVQATYMDWVITGKKEEVEYWFSVVDQESALAHVEKSKVSLHSPAFYSSSEYSNRLTGSHALGRRSGRRWVLRVQQGKADPQRLVCF